MFDTREEAEELNSECAFCGLLKFYIDVDANYMYHLKRCHDDTCNQHCKFGHEVRLEIVHASEDMTDIASVYGKS